MSTEIINEAGSGLVTPKNTGARGQKMEGAVKSYILAKETMSFDSVSDSRNKEKWDQVKANKEIVPFFEVEVLEPNNTEATIANKRFEDKKTKKGVRGVTYTHELSSESHAALASFDETQEYTRIFRVTTENEILCEVQEDGSVKGEPIASFIVGLREDATDENDSTTKVQIKFKEYNMSIVKPEFDLNEYEGIFDVVLSLGVVSATSMKFGAKSFGASVTNLADANIVVKDASGSIHPATFVPFDSDNEVYELTGTGFTDGFTIDIDGVQVVGAIHIESTGALKVTGI